MERFDDLVSDYLDGALDAVGQEELTRLLEADPERLREFVDLVRANGILRVELGKPAGDDFARMVIADLEKDKTRFIRAVMSDVRGSRGGGGPPDLRGSRPGNRGRKGGRPPGRFPSAWTGWVVAGAAAVFILILLAALGDNEQPMRRERPRPERAPLAERKETTAPSAPEAKEPPSPRPPQEPPPKFPVPRPTPEERAVKTPEESPLRPPDAPKPPAPSPTPLPPAPKPLEQPTVVVIATLDQVEGEVTRTRGGEKKPAVAGEGLLAGDVLESSTGAAALKYSDGTRVESRGVLRLQAADGAKHLFLEQGALKAQVAKQPAGKPMVFFSAYGEATVLGTTLRLTVDPDPKEGMRLDVEEGKVRLLRKADGRTVDVVVGHYAVAAAGSPMTSRVFRIQDGLQALYTFKEARGGIVRDVSRAGTPLDLKIENEQSVRWSPKGLLLTGPTLVATPGPAARIVQACRTSNEVSLEVWFRPATVTPAAKDGRILTLSSDIKNQNFMIGQDEYQGPTRSYFVRLRSTGTDLVGKPATPLPDGTAAPKVTHLVFTRAASGAVSLYVDGVEATRGNVGGNLSNWNDGYRLGLGNEFSNDRPWLGELQLAAVYSRALGADEVKQNHRAGTE